MASGISRASARRSAALAVVGLLMVAAGCGSGAEPSPEAVDEPSTTETSRPTATSERPATTPTTTAVPSTTTTTPAATAAPGLPAGEDVTVVRIIDGDTLVVSGDVRVRLIGIDTPELRQDECYADEATVHLGGLVAPGAEVRLVFDVERLDLYDRTLAYLYRPNDGLFVNLAMVGDGYAQPLTIPPNVAHADEFVAAADEARSAARGLWSACGDEGAAASPPPASPPARGGGGCDPAYVGVCIPPAPPDLDCGDIAHRRFQVLPPDPHGFDGNGDGVGCES